MEVSGLPVNDERVRETITMGRGKMPPFGNLLDERQLADLIAYLKTL